MPDVSMPQARHKPVLYMMRTLQRHLHSEPGRHSCAVLSRVLPPRCSEDAHLELGGEGGDAITEACQLSSLNLGGPRAGLQLVHLPLHGRGSLSLLLQLLHRQCSCVAGLDTSCSRPETGNGDSLLLRALQRMCDRSRVLGKRMRHVHNLSL